MNELPIFNATHKGYKFWKEKLTDHAAENNHEWRDLLRYAQLQDTPIHPNVLLGLRYGNMTGWDLALDLWGFISKRIDENTYDRRVTLAHGWEGNGFELWRRFFHDYEGGDELVQNDGRTRLQTFPPITKGPDLVERLDDWQQMMNRFGNDIGHATQRTMLLKILPPDMRQDVNKQRDLMTTEDIISYLRRQTAWDRSESIIRNASKRGSVHAVTEPPAASMTALDATREIAPASTQEIVHAVIAALNGKGGGKGGKAKGGGKGDRSRSQSPSAKARAAFPKDTCYHCKKAGHSRTAGKNNRPACPEFAEIIRKNNGKLPDGYKGAFEKHMEEFKKKAAGGVHAVTPADIVDAMNSYVDSEDDSSDDESFDSLHLKAIWNGSPSCCDESCACEPPPVSGFKRPPKKQRSRMQIVSPITQSLEEFPMLAIPQKPIIPVTNSFQTLQDDAFPTLAIPEPVDPSEITGTLKNWAHNVSRASDKNIKNRKGWKLKTDEDVARFQKLLCSAQHKNPEKALKRLEQDDAIDDLARIIDRKGSKVHQCSKAGRKVWAMMDSGSFVTIADCKKHFGPEFKVEPSSGSKNGQIYSNASGGEIRNRGEVTITHMLDDGSTLDLVVQDADVAVPILSVKDFVVKGSVVKFKLNGGTVKLPDGRRLIFQERHGVYFICLNIIPPNDDNADNNICGAICECKSPAPFGRPAP